MAEGSWSGLGRTGAWFAYLGWRSLGGLTPYLGQTSYLAG